MAGLASPCWNKDRWEEAEGAGGAGDGDKKEYILGAEYPDILNSIYNLAFT